MFPSFLLAKLYVKCSLKNNETGFEFALKNILDSTILIKLGPVVADGVTYEGDAIQLVAGDRVYNGKDLSTQSPVEIRIGVPMKISVTGARLPAGPQKISIAATTSDIGQIKFDISDTVN